jgi:hypothetical protein
MKRYEFLRCGSGLVALGWALTSFLAATAVAQDKPEATSSAVAGYDPLQPEASNMRLVGYNDLQGRGAYQPVVKRQGDRWIAYVGSQFGGPDRLNTLTGQVEANGTSIIDVTDPTNPKYIAHILGEERPGGNDYFSPGRYPRGQGQYVQVCGGSELPHAEKGKFYLLRDFGYSRWEMWDVTDPAKPTKITDIGPSLEGLHKGTWECNTGIAYLPSGLFGWPLPTGTKHNAINHMAIWDLSNPAKPVLIRHWGLPGQNPGSTTPVPIGDLNTIISSMNIHDGTGPGRNRLYVGYGNTSNGIWVILDRDKLLNGPKEPTDENMRYPIITRVDMPPDMGGHTPFPMFDMELPQFAHQAGGKVKDFIALTAQQTGTECHVGVQGEDGSAQLLRMYDINYETRPVGVASWYVSEESGNFCSRGGRFGPHDQSNDFSPIYYKRVVLLTYWNAGVRAVDIRDPYHPKEIGYYIPAINPKFAEDRCVGNDYGFHGADSEKATGKLLPGRGEDCKKVIETNMLTADSRGYIYAVDHASNGMVILDLTGPAREVPDYSKAEGAADAH